MKLLVAGLLAAATFAVTVPASAQEYYYAQPYVGSRVDPYTGGFYANGGYPVAPMYQGRSVYRSYDNDYNDYDDGF